MQSRLRAWWALGPADVAEDADKAHAPLRPEHRRRTLPLLTLAFGWGFLITGLIVGGALGKGMPMNEVMQATFIGNGLTFVIGALVGYIGFRTGCNSGLLYRYVYGRMGAAGPAIFVALLTIGWQGIIVGAFGFAWTQSFSGSSFYAVAILAGLLFTVTTYFGVRGLELLSIPATILLVGVGIYAGITNVLTAGGWDAFLVLSERSAGQAPLTMTQAVNLVIGSWIVGAIVMPEYTRFAKSAWVAIAIPFIVLIVAQWFLQIVGAIGGIVTGTHDFTTYMLAQGAVVGGIGVIAMSVALWTTGDTNLYLPAVQTASVFKRPQRVTTVICGILGTILGLGIYQQFLGWIDVLASIVPPLVGPILVDFYITGRDKYLAGSLENLPNFSASAFVAYALGAGSTFLAPTWLVPSLLGLAISIAAYWVLVRMARLTKPVPTGPQHIKE